MIIVPFMVSEAVRCPSVTTTAGIWSRNTVYIQQHEYNYWLATSHNLNHGCIQAWLIVLWPVQLLCLLFWQSAPTAHCNIHPIPTPATRFLWHWLMPCVSDFNSAHQSCNEQLSSQDAEFIFYKKTNFKYNHPVLAKNSSWWDESKVNVLKQI